MLETLIALTQITFFVVYSVLGFLYVTGILLVWKYHWQKERIINETEVKERGEYSGQTKSFAEGRVRELRERERPQLQKLERRQKFILDILPFIRKF